MENRQRMNRLEAKAIVHGFSVERDDTTMIIGRDGFRYMFKTDIDDIQLTLMIQDAESFMKDIMRLKHG